MDSPSTLLFVSFERVFVIVSFVSSATAIVDGGSQSMESLETCEICTDQAACEFVTIV